MGGGRRRLRIWAAPAAAVVLVVAALVAWVLHGSRDTTNRSAPPAGAARASTGQQASSAPGQPSASVRPSASASPKPSATTPPVTSAPPSTSDTSVPAGFVRYRDPTGFSIVVPSGWWRVPHSPRVDFQDPASGRFLRIDQTTHPKGDPYEDWIRQEKPKLQWPGYHRIRLVRVSYRGWQAADWEFTFRTDGATTHVLNRNIVPSAHRAYALYWSTPDSQWSTSDSQRILRIAEQTFTPAP